jgi:hypothetical protein
VLHTRPWCAHPEGVWVGGGGVGGGGGQGQGQALQCIECNRQKHGIYITLADHTCGLEAIATPRCPSQTAASPQPQQHLLGPVQGLQEQLQWVFASVASFDASRIEHLSTSIGTCLWQSWERSSSQPWWSCGQSTNATARKCHLSCSGSKSWTKLNVCKQCRPEQRNSSGRLLNGDLLKGLEGCSQHLLS